MKKKLTNIILVAAIALSSVLVISCSKEDKVNKTDNKNVTATNSVKEPSNGIAEESVKISPVIVSIENINASINQGEQYSLPDTVEAKLSDNTTRTVNVNWSPASIDVNKAGTFLSKGSVSGYEKKVVLQLVVKTVAKEIKMDKALKTKLDTFFSNFSEAFVEPFEEGNIDDESLIDFAISHIRINNWGGKNNMVEDRKDDMYTGYIHSSNIDKKTYRYFGKVVKEHDKNYYTFPFASGEAYTFSQIDKLYNIGGNFYTADISIYMASSGFTGDSHGTMDYWKKSNPHDVPELQKKMTAKIKKVSEEGNERYLLVSYKLK